MDHRDKITSKIARLDLGRPYVSLEFFPPKTHQGTQNLNVRLERMARALRPLFVTVTWGAGGSTAQKSLHLADVCQRQMGLTTCLHLTCTNMSKSVLDEALEGAKEIGIRNILALRGDPPRTDEYRNTACDPCNGGSPAPDAAEAEGPQFVYAIDLVKYIRESHGDYFCVGVAAYPEGHAEGSCPEVQDPLHDLPYLVEKVQAGADFIITQLFYDVDAYLRFEKLLREHPSGAFKDIPIIPGLMPIQSYPILRRTTKLSNAKLPPALLERLEPVKGDDESVKNFGVDYLSNVIARIREAPSPCPRGFHFYTLNLEKAISFLLERSDLIPLGPGEVPAIEVADGPVVLNGTSQSRRTRRASSAVSDPHNRVIVDNIRAYAASLDRVATPLEAGQKAPPQPADITLAISEGEGALGREATWDDYTNGRFGDSRSPAFGEIDGYGVSLHVSREKAYRLWSYPTTHADISSIFIRHICDNLEAIPWSEQELNPESSLIRQQLVRLNQRGWWTVASQPAVNSAPSGDPTFGWGPKSGFVFQKAFVEFFIPKGDWENLEKELIACGKDVVSYYAGDREGNFSTNMEGRRGEDAVNAVTWGCFPGKEIVTPTIVEEIGFKAWREEAFGIWIEWSRLYPRSGPTARLLCGIANGYWLVNVIHHDYMQPMDLWRVLGVAE